MPPPENEGAEWTAWRETRDAELGALGGCMHGAPAYAMCEEIDDAEALWCTECGSLGNWMMEADPGHQVDLPIDDSQRGPGWDWSPPAALTRACRLRNHLHVLTAAWTSNANHDPEPEAASAWRAAATSLDELLLETD